MKLILSSYLTLTLLVGYLGAVTFRCDYSYSKEGWFKYHKIPVTWRDARLRCLYEGGMLASPTSTAIRVAMMSAIGEVDIYTGIHAISPGNFYSIDGQPLDTITHRWAENEPDNKDNAERCISMNFEGNFSDVNCDVPRPYMCFRPISLLGTNECGTPDKAYRFEKRTRKCYKFHTVPRTFERAHFVCSAEGGHLLIINSNLESQIVRELFLKYPEKNIMRNFRKDVAFIGFNNWGESTDWKTIHGQSLQQAGFNVFFPGEPNNGGQPNNSTDGEYCGSVYRNGFLNDLRCEHEFAFICEKRPDYPTVCDSDNFDSTTPE